MGGFPALAEFRRMQSVLGTPLTLIKGVGPKIGEKLAKKGLLTVEDALFFLPIRYEDRTRLAPIRELRHGQSATFQGELISLEVKFYRRRRALEGLLADSTGVAVLKWFHGNFDWLRKRYPVGSTLIAYGQVSDFGGRHEVIHPDLEIIGGAEEGEMETVTPVYSEVEGVHPRALRKIMKKAVEAGASVFLNVVPPDAAALSGIEESAWADMGKVFRELHFPSRGGEELEKIVASSRQVLVLSEFFLLQLALLRKREGVRAARGISFHPDFVRIKPLLRSLPWELTGAQRRVLGEIRRDMESETPMHRLLQGDVGSGKTLVALLSSLMAVESGYQSAIMAPTEVLAEQHYANISVLLKGFPVRAALLTGSTPAGEREKLLGELAAGEIDIIIGTHALIQPDVEFKSLGLAIVDEQHRFGVMQRALLAGKRRDGLTPDMLVMTATPIPRSLSMTVYGDLDLSVIDEMPPGRKPVKTRIVRLESRQKAYDFIRGEIGKGRQAYIVCPLVEESDKVDLRAAVETSLHFSTEVFPELRVGLLHGRMKADEKELVLRAFYGGEIDILVSTTVIEVGIDVKNASVMAVEHAERFGLSQLHQLRGRVGRGEHDSFCFLMVGGPVSGDARERLSIMEKSCDGFRISEEDLKIRGPGDMLGTRQSGLPELRVGNILTDGPLLERARRMAQAVLQADPSLESEGNRLLVAMLSEGVQRKLAILRAG
jgi:ATP-dependent DNA helicase RecG